MSDKNEFPDENKNGSEQIQSANENGATPKDGAVANDDASGEDYNYSGIYENMGKYEPEADKHEDDDTFSENEINDYLNMPETRERRIGREARERKSSRTPRKNKNVRPYAILTSIIVFSLLLVGSYIAYIYITEFMPNYKREGFFERHNELDATEINIVLEAEYITGTNHPVMMNDGLYLPVDFIKEYIDSYIFWDQEREKIIITTENRVIRMNSTEPTYYVNNDPMRLNTPFYAVGKDAYLPVDFVTEMYNVSVSHEEKYNLVIIDYLGNDRIITTATANTRLRYEPDVKSLIQADIKKEDGLRVYGENGDFTMVRTADGLLGYVLSDKLGKQETIQGTALEEPVYETPEPKKIKGRITACWDQITTVEANSLDWRREEHTGLDVLMPTWFSFDDALNGDIVSIADKSYVDWAHQNGYQVWALITDNFNSTVSHAILSDSNIREHVIRQLLAFATVYELDGINIDFEMVRKDDADCYIQFMRELYPLMKLQGTVLSVDMYVPMSFNLYYNRTEVAKASDYIIIMGYDEHYAGSEESGPVASIGFVEDGIFGTLKETGPSKVILGIPFYVRVWREEPDGDSISVTSNAYSMSTGRKIFDEQGAEFEWLENLGCYYAEYTSVEDGKEITYKVWLEDEDSLERKLTLAEKYELAGVAAWKRGLENDGVWELIKSYNKK